MNGLVLRRVFLASLRTRRLATLLSLLAIALGVALGLAVQLIHGVALDEFASGMRRLGGEADLRVLGSREGFDDALFAPLAARPEVALALPVLDLEVQVPAADAANGDDAPRLRIVALDVLQAARITPALAPRLADEAGTADERNALRLLGDDALFLSAAAQTRFGVAAGDVLTVQAGAQRARLVVRGGVPGAASGEELGVMDIAVAQQAFARIGRLSRIDLRLRDGVALSVAQPALATALPAGLVAITPAAEAGQNQALSRAYRVNLTMLAAMALLTGAFLVFSTQWLAVVRRRGMFAVLRALGLDAAALRRALLIEGGVLGLVGGVLGVLLAYALSALLLRYVGADLGGGYFAGVVPALRLAPGVSALYLVLGVVAGVAGAWWPAREAAAMAVARGLRSGDEMSAWAAWPVSLRGSALAAAVAALLCLLPAWAGVAAGGYAAVLMLLIAAVAALPWLVARFERLPVPPHSALPRLARARLAAMPGQAVVAGAGVVASVALAVSMAVMVASFRDSVDHWLGRVLPADVYVRSSGAGAFLDPAAPAALATVPGVARAEAIRFDSVRLDDRRYPQTLIAREVDDGRSLHGIEQRRELVEKSQALAARLGFDGMRFHAGDTAAALDAPEIPTDVDVVTALHACNTATDDALRFALARRARFIVLVPCCQAEVAAALRARKNVALGATPLAELWRHPIHTREFGSHLTNVLRCLLLEAHGYQLSVTELVGWEHAMKNELILARRTGQPRGNARARAEAILNELQLDTLAERFLYQV